MAEGTRRRAAAAEEPAPEKKKRGPVPYHAFAELAPGWWALVAADREASSVYVLRKELSAELRDAQHAAGVQPLDAPRIVICPSRETHVVEAAQEVTVKESFRKVTLEAGPPIGMMVQGPGPAPESEAAIAARAGATPMPPEAVPPASAEPDDSPNAALAAAALRAARAADPHAGTDTPRRIPTPTVPVNPDLDPETGLSRRRGSQSVPSDEGRTVFPVGDEPLPPGALHD